MYQEKLYLTEVFQTIKQKFLDALGHMQNHPGLATEEGSDVLTCHRKKSNESILSRFGEIFSSIFRQGDYRGCNKTTIEETEKNLHILQENWNLQQEQIQKQFALANFIRIELEITKS